MDNTKIIARIQKLMALGTSDNEQEAALAIAKAQTLLMEYNISESELSNYSNEKTEKVTRIRTDGKNRRNSSNWYNGLADVVAHSNLCKILISGSGLIWIGKPTNIEIAQYMTDALANDLQRIAEKIWAQLKVGHQFRCNECWRNFDFEEAKAHGIEFNHNKWDSVPAKSYLPHGKTWKNNFYFGATQAISARLTANLKELRVGEKINALVVANDYELKEYMSEHYPRLGTKGFSTNYNRSGFEAGKSAGVGAGGSAGPKLIERV